MSSASSRSAALLAEIAATLRVPVETFTASPRQLSEMGRSASIQTAAMLMDPLGGELAAIFVALPHSARVSLLRVGRTILDQMPAKPDVEPAP